MRVAIYARFSSEMQRATSIDDQIAVARSYATSRNWAVLDDHVYADLAVSGASLERPGIQALLAAAARRPLPFDVLLVDDSSRISRDLADALRVLQQLRFLGCRVVYISQGIDSISEQAETLVAVHGMVDGLFLREMAAKIKRGLAGQIDRGFSTGSRTYGYRTVPVVDPSGKTDTNGYPLLLGKRVEIEPDEARTVVAIFEMYASGLGAGRIVERLNREGHRGIGGTRWKQGAVKRCLSNEKYLGRLIWGQKTFDRRPGTRQLVARAVPRSQWRVQERPDLRIISDELWQRVQDRRQAVKSALPAESGRTLMRGRSAALHSRHLFSGSMTCAECGGAIVAVTGGHGSPRYGCLRSWRNGVSTCGNRLTIRAKVADAYLLAGLKSELTSPSTVRYITDRLAEALNQQIDDRPRLLAEARVEREQAAQRLQRLVDAIEQGVPAATLTTAISERQADIARLDATVADLESDPLRQRLAVMPAWVGQQLEDLSGLLSESPERAKTEFRRLALSVSMAAVETEDVPRPFYRATVAAALPCLTGIRDLSATTVDRSDPRSAGSRPWSFEVDLPANQPGPGSKRRVG